jgi:hypothetical protein
MAARLNGPLGFQLRIDDKFAPGFPQSGHSLRLTVPGAIGTQAWHVAAGLSQRKAGEHQHHPPGSSPLEKFQLALIEKQTEVRESHGRKSVQKLERSELGPIPDKKSMRKDIALLFQRMWDEMEKEFKARSNASAGDSVGVASGYRSAEQDRMAWYGAFPKYYRNTLQDRLATGDEFGHKALTIIFNYMNGRKAPPGFSGHTLGIAADLTTHENGKTWTVNSDYNHQVGWQKTWLYQWLVANAWKHKFYQLKTETWHWEYHKDGPNEQCWGGQVTHRPVKKPKS